MQAHLDVVVPPVDALPPLDAPTRDGTLVGRAPDDVQSMAPVCPATGTARA